MLTMIQYSQMHGKITATESLRVTSCVCKEEALEKFRFVVVGEDAKSQVPVQILAADIFKTVLKIFCRKLMGFESKSPFCYFCENVCKITTVAGPWLGCYNG
jgi:hypothetical protein